MIKYYFRILLGLIIAFFLIVLLWPKLQNPLVRFLVKVLSEKTSWQISFKEASWSPLRGLKMVNLNVYKDGIQKIHAKEAFIEYSFSLRQPYITLESANLEEPLLAVETSWQQSSASQKGEGKDTPYGESIISSFNKISIHKGRLALLKEGRIYLSLKDFSGIVRIVSQEEKRTFYHEIHIDTASFVVDNPTIGLIRLSGLASISENGITLRDLSAFSDGWAIMRVSGFWGFHEKRGYFSASLDDFNAFHIPYTRPFKDLIGRFSADCSLLVQSSSMEVDYRISDPLRGFIKGKAFITNDKERGWIISQKNIYDFNYANTSYSFRLKGTSDSVVTVDNENHPALQTTINLSDSRTVLRDKLSLAIHKGLLSLYYDKHSVKLERFAANTSLGDFAGTLESGGSRGLKVFLKWNTEGSRSGRLLEQLITTKVTQLELIKGSSVSLHLSCKTLPCHMKEAQIGADINIYGSDSPILSLNTHLNNGSLNLSLASSIKSLDSVKNLLPGEQIPLQGSFSMKANLSGTIDRARFAASGRIEKGLYKNLSFEKVIFSTNGEISSQREPYQLCQGFTIIDRCLTIDQIFSLKSSHLNIGGDFAISEGMVSFKQRNSHITFSGTAKAPKNNLSAEAAGYVSNLWNNPSFVITKTSIKLPDIGGPITGTLKGKVRAASTVEIEDLAIVQNDQLVRGSGTIKRDGSVQGDLKIVTLKIPETIIKKWDIQAIGGDISGEVHLRGSLQTPLLKGNLSLKKGQLLYNPNTKFDWTKASLTFDFDGTRMVLNGLLDTPSVKHPITILGEIPSTLSLAPFTFQVYKNKPFKSTIVISEADLSGFALWLAPFQKVKGILDMNVNLYGTLDKLQAEGKGSLKQGEITYKNYGASDLEGSFIFRPDHILLEELKANVFKGKVILKGIVPYSLDAVNINAYVKDIVIPKFYGISGNGSGEFLLTMKQGFPLIEGTFVATEAELDIDNLKDQVRKTIDVVEVYKGDYNDQSSLVKPSTIKPQETRDFTMNILVDMTQSKARIKGFGIKEEVGGKLWLRKQVNDTIRLEGTIEHRQGWYEFQQVKLDISEGHIIFKGFTKPDPELYFVGQKTVGDITVWVYITGYASDPQITLKSSPPMNEIDMISYLLFNRPANSITSKESVGLQEQAAVFLGSKASDIIKKFVGPTPFTPDVLQVRESTTGSNVIEIGKYLTSDFYVTYEKNLRTDEGSSINLEYRFNRHLSIQSQIGNSRQSGVDLLWRYDFGN